MILKGSQRGGATQLAIHLQRMDENDHVELHEVRGFIADDLGGALREAYAISKGTRCEQFLFSLSLSPPETAVVPVAVFEEAISDVEGKLGLFGQPRVVIFHEKNGRRHAHCVWSRINAEAMKAINLPHFKLKLRDVSRELYLEHGWRMPLGLVNSAERDPRNFTRAEWQQAKRAGTDAGDLKELFQDCWAISDSAKGFGQALEQRGFYLARGDRRGFVALDVNGEVYSIPKWTGLKTKQVEARLGDPASLRSVAETNTYISELLQGMLGRHLAEAEQAHRSQRQPLLVRKADLRMAQGTERSVLQSKQDARATTEARQRVARFRTGVRGLWDRLVGRHRQIRRENEAAAIEADHRDAREKDALIRAQLAQRRALQAEVRVANEAAETEIRAVHREQAELRTPTDAEARIRDTNALARRLRRKRDDGPTMR